MGPRAGTPSSAGAIAGLVGAAAGGLVLALAAAGWMATETGRAADGGSSARPGPHVGAAELSTALASRVPERPTLADEIAHFEARLTSRGDEPFSRLRLVSAHLLSFRAYGREDHLAAAERHVAAKAADGSASDASATGASATDAAAVGRASALHLARHEFGEAFRTAVAAHDLAGGRAPEHALGLFDALWATGRYEAAEAMLGPPLDQGSIGVLSRRARVLDRQGNVEAARDLSRSVLEKVRAYAEPAPVEAWALVELGRFEHHAGDPARAVELYLEALEVLPGSPAALEALGDVALGVDRNPAAASALLRRALAHGAHLDAMLTLADAEEARGDTDEAERLRDVFVREATADARTERSYLRPLAFVLARDEDTRHRALAYARRDLETRRDAGAWDALAWVRYRRGDVDAAWRAARLAVMTGSPEPAVAWRAGIIADAAGATERSRELLEIALEGASELPLGEVEEARRRLAAGPR